MEEIKQTPANKRFILSNAGYETIYQAKKDLQMTAPQIYDYLFSEYARINFELKKGKIKEKIKREFADHLKAIQKKMMEKKIKKEKVIQFIQLEKTVESWNKRFNKKSKPFEVILTSATTGFVKAFKFASLEHFLNWIHKILSTGEGSKPETKNAFDNMKSLFDFITVKFKFIAGGCNKHTKTDKHLKTSFYDFVLFNPVSMGNNCFFHCLDKIIGKKIDIKKVRAFFELKGKISIADTYKIIKYHTDNDIEIIDFEHIPDLENDKIYILLKDEHYYVVESFTEVIKKDIKTKRGTIEFDIETRPTENFFLIKASDTKSFILKDAITCAYVKKYKAEQANELLFKTDSVDGISSTRKFIDFLNCESLAGRTYNILAHNGGNFDFYFIVNILTEQELRDCKIQMRGITIIGINYRGNLFKDSYCFLTFSLDSLSKNFKVDNGKITTCVVNGQTITSSQLCFYKPDLTFNEFLELDIKDVDFWRQYVKYCTYDCIALHEIWVKFTACVNELISSINPYLLRFCPLMSSNTIGSHSKKIISALNHSSTKYEWAGKSKKELDLFINEDIEKYNFLKKFKRGGISHCNKAGKHLSGITGVDIASQYPASLIYARIPVGLSNWTEIYDDKLFGFYHLKNLVFETDYKFKPIASIKENGVLEWNSDNVNEIHLDSYTIKYLVDNYGLKSFDVISGLVSTKDIKADKLFGKYVNTFYTEKKNQDALKKLDDPEYNPALRETIKLYLNSLTGKLVEDPSIHYSLEYVLGLKEEDLQGDGSKEDMKIMDDLERQQSPQVSFNGVQSAKVAHKDKINDWIITGIMVYSYSKRLLFEYIKCLPNNSNDVIHIETDSIYFSSRLKEKFLENVGNYKGEYPCMMGDDLGNLKIEKCTGEGQVAYFLGKKFYNITNEKDSIIKVKGIPQQTIDKFGNKVKLVDTALFETIYSGKSVTRTFQTMKKNLFCDSSYISSHSMTRTVRGLQDFKLYQ